MKKWIRVDGKCRCVSCEALVTDNDVARALHACLQPSSRPTVALGRSILDRNFAYINSVETDVRKTFARLRRQQRIQSKPASVTPIKKVVS